LAQKRKLLTLFRRKAGKAAINATIRVKSNSNAILPLSVQNCQKIKIDLRKNLRKIKKNLRTGCYNVGMNTSNQTNEPTRPSNFFNINQPEYPTLLKHIHQPPQKLYYKGDPEILQKDILIAFVGTRKSTQYGAYITEQIISDLSMCDAVIVSGLARGIDTLAHKAALKYGLKTVAVLGTGIYNIYPDENKPLADEIISKGGCILSEYAGDTPPKDFQFPMRNRIIAGLSTATVVIEAPEKSGALITAKRANESDREVFAVPGDIGSPQSIGCNKLIQNLEAKLITNGLDIMRELSLGNQLSFEEVAPKHIGTKEQNTESLCKALNLHEDTTKILALIPKLRPISRESLIELSKTSPQTLNKILSLLEISGLISTTNSGFYMRTC